jgi:hypothetical protein
LSNSIINSYDQESSKNANYKHAVFPIVSYDKAKNNIMVLDLAIEQALEFKKENLGK